MVNEGDVSSSASMQCPHSPLERSRNTLGWVPICGNDCRGKVMQTATYSYNDISSFIPQAHKNPLDFQSTEWLKLHYRSNVWGQ